MRTLGQSLFALFVGAIVALVLVIAVEAIGAKLHPFPPGADPSDMAVCRDHVAKLPTSVLVIAVIGWALAVFCAAWIATRLGTARHPAHGVVLGGLLIAAAVFNMSMLPYPIWFWIGNLIAMPAALVLALRLAGPSSATPTAG